MQHHYALLVITLIIMNIVLQTGVGAVCIKTASLVVKKNLLVISLFSCVVSSIDPFAVAL